MDGAAESNHTACDGVVGLFADAVRPWSDPAQHSSGVRERPPQLLPANAVLAGAPCQQLGPYLLLEPIGSGAMGRVYRARHVMLSRLVAIKVLRPELAANQACVDHFIAEAQALSRLNHAHVIDVTDMGRGPNGTPWFVMELLEGADLGDMLCRESIGLARSLEIIRQVCKGLDAIHSVGIVHCDIKPENIFIIERERRDFVKLIDFGVARMRDTQSALPPVHPEGLVGTPQYMAPEQSGNGEIDHRADLYGVGAVLFELVTGDTPFRRIGLWALLDDLRFAQPPVPSTRVELPIAVRAEIDRLIGRCLAKNPADRPQSAREIGATIEGIAARLAPAPVTATPKSSASRESCHAAPRHDARSRDRLRDHRNRIGA